MDAAGGRMMSDEPLVAGDWRGYGADWKLEGQGDCNSAVGEPEGCSAYQWEQLGRGGWAHHQVAAGGGGGVAMVVSV